MFKIVENSIERDTIRYELQSPQNGAFVTFEGLVRNHNEGKEVTSLEYECFQQLAEKEGEKIFDEARVQFLITKAVGFHRVGHLNIGECAVWLGVSSAHRDAAFRAARFIIDEIKIRLPIWKKEHYSDAPSKWVNCQNCDQYHIEKNITRKNSLSGVSALGQEIL